MTNHNISVGSVNDKGNDPLTAIDQSR